MNSSTSVCRGASGKGASLSFTDCIVIFIKSQHRFLVVSLRVADHLAFDNDASAAGTMGLWLVFGTMVAETVWSRRSYAKIDDA